MTMYYLDNISCGKCDATSGKHYFALSGLSGAFSGLSYQDSDFSWQAGLHITVHMSHNYSQSARSNQG